MILVSILGDFHSSIFPLFCEFEKQISKHIVVYDDVYAKRREYKALVSSLGNYADKHLLDIQTQEHIIQEDSLLSINALIKMIEKLAREEQVYVNTTDGLANITLLLGQKLLESGVKMLAYDMHANSYNVITQGSMEKKKITKSMSIEDHFLLKGYEIKTKEDKTFAHENAAAIRELFEKYLKEFELLRKDATKNNIREERYPRAHQLVSMMGLDFQTQQKVITGGLFEWYVYLLVKDLGFSDIEVGVTIADPFTPEISIINEFDILLMRENHLHVIECKYRSSPEIGSLVYKYAHLMNIIDDDGRVIIVTKNAEYAADIYSKQVQGAEHHRRAHKNKIMIRSSIVQNRAKFIEDVKMHLL